jgi:tRNA-specific 2-thiouridylase
VTPNPCVDCNNKVKFKELRQRALSFGATHVATGHYARIHPVEGGFGLFRGRDGLKDQSYFLYGLTQAELSHTLFPVGALTKAEVRAEARRLGLETAEKPESQDICFVSGSVKEFMSQRGVPAAHGKIVTRAGQVLGTHEGVHGFTVGQRRGIGVGGRRGAPEAPLYVVEIDPVNQLVVVGTKDELERSSFAVGEMNWQCPSIAAALRRGQPFEVSCRAQLRYRHAGVPVRVRVDPALPDEVQVQFENAWASVSPGQAAVFYDTENERVLGGGRMLRSESDAPRAEPQRRQLPRSLQIL